PRSSGALAVTSTPSAGDRFPSASRSTVTSTPALRAADAGPGLVAASRGLAGSASAPGLGAATPVGFAFPAGRSAPARSAALGGDSPRSSHHAAAAATASTAATARRRRAARPIGSTPGRLEGSYDWPRPRGRNARAVLSPPRATPAP